MTDKVKEKSLRSERLVLLLTLEEKTRLKAICGGMNLKMNDLLRDVIEKTLDSIETAGGYKFGR